MAGWAGAVGARRYQEDEETTHGSIFVYTNSNNTRGELGSLAESGGGGEAQGRGLRGAEWESGKLGVWGPGQWGSLGAGIRISGLLEGWIWGPLEPGIRGLRSGGCQSLELGG